MTASPIPPIPPGWKTILSAETREPYFRQLQAFLAEEQKEHTVYPPRAEIFTALKLTPFSQVRVLLLGQDPYHDGHQAHGLAFSVRPGVRPPPSLQNIFKELKADLGYPIPNNGYLVPWAQQGVLLLNAVLTVRAHQPNSHKNKGWEKFTDRVIQALSDRATPVVFILWGGYAKKKTGLIDHRHPIIQSAHPSPLSAANGFFGSRPFSKVNAALRTLGQPEIDWQIPNIQLAGNQVIR